MDNAFVVCPICSKNVRSHTINKHLDESCSEGTTIQVGPSDQELLQLSPTILGGAHKKPPKPNPAALAPIFTPNAKGKGTSTYTQTSQPQRTDQPHVAQSKRAIDIDSPAPPPKRKKATNPNPNIPLAERLRPRDFSEFIGQAHLTGPGSLIATALQTNANWSIVLWGPPGCGKTSLAKLIAERSDAVFKELSATASGVNEVKSVVEEAKRTLSLLGRKTILFLDEIHRFNKSQQDVFLPVVERGIIQLIGATTENPSFRLTGALLSRCRVLRLEPFSNQDMTELLARALRKIKIEESKQDEGSSPKDLSQVIDLEPPSEPDDESQLTPRILSRIVSMAGGDARTALSLLEVVLRSPKEASEQQIMDALKQSLVVSYDRTGEDHYDMISALHKSIRGSHGDAAMYWLARMLTAGEDPVFIARRMVVCASEDIGLADNHALPLAMATMQACQVIGMPECRINLAHLAAYLSEAPKSTRAYEAYNRAEETAKKTATIPVPMQIRNAPTALMEEMGYGKEYRYNPDYKHPVHNEYLPRELSKHKFLLKPGDVSGKLWDEQALDEWERENGPWEGRTA